MSALSFVLKPALDLHSRDPLAPSISDLTLCRLPNKQAAPLSPLESALTGFSYLPDSAHVKVHCFHPIQQNPPVTPLESALTSHRPISPLESALTKYPRGWSPHLDSRRSTFGAGSTEDWPQNGICDWLDTGAGGGRPRQNNRL